MQCCGDLPAGQLQLGSLMHPSLDEPDQLSVWLLQHLLPDRWDLAVQADVLEPYLGKFLRLPIDQALSTEEGREVSGEFLRRILDEL